MNIRTMSKKNLFWIYSTLSLSILLIVVSLIFLNRFFYNRDLFLRRRSANEVVAISSYEVPFASRDSRFNSSELIETDAYGRKLFLYSMVDRRLGFGDYSENSKTHVYIVCQKADGKTVSYYPFICYSFVGDLNGNTEKIISNLKSANDWGMPINEAELITKSIYIDTDEREYREEKEKVASNFFDKIGETFDTYAYTSFSEGNSIKMYIIREYSLNENNMCNYKRSFLIMADNSFNIISYTELTGIADSWQEQIVAFKCK